MKDYRGRRKISINTRKDILNYYLMLFKNCEIKSIPEIAYKLSIADATVRRFIADIYEGFNENGKISYIDAVILSCTKFGPNSPYLEDQQRENIQLIIKRRKIEKAYLLYEKSKGQNNQDEISHKRR